MVALWRRMRGSVVVQNAAWLYLVQITGYLVPLITLPYLSRVLSVQNFGLIAFANSIIWNFIVLTDYGFNLTATRQVALERDDPEALSRTFNAVLVAKALLTLAGFLILLVLIFMVPRFRPHAALFVVSFLTVIGYLLFPVWLFQGLQKMKHIAVRDFLAKCVGLLVLFTLVRTDEDVLIAAASQSLGLVLAGIVGLASVPFIAPVRFAWPGVAAVWQALRTGWPPFLSLSASTVVYSADVMLLEARASAVEVGYLNAAWRIISVPRTLVGPISTAIYSHLSQNASRSEGEAIRFVRRYGFLLAVPFLAMSAGLLLTASWIVPLVLGPKYISSTPVLQILAIGPFLVAMAHAYSTYYMLPCGYDRQWMHRMLFSLVVNVAVFVPLLLSIRGSLALALAMTAMDVAAVLAYRAFFVKRAAHIEGIEAQGISV